MYGVIDSCAKTLGSTVPVGQQVGVLLSAPPLDDMIDLATRASQGHAQS